MNRKWKSAWRVVMKEKGRLVNWPNGLTMLRIISVPFVGSYIEQKKIFWAVLLFIFAAFTDYLDGKIARKYKQETKVGEILDQGADKIFVLYILWCIYKVDYINLWTWVFMVIFWREIIIGLGRIFTLDTEIGSAVTVNQLGRIKAGVQYIGIPWTILKWPEFNYIMAFVAVLTLISGVVYLCSFVREFYRRYWKYFKRLMLALKNNMP